MSVKLRKFFKVSYDSHEHAAAALFAAKEKFHTAKSPCKDFNRCEGNSVFYEKSENAVHDSIVKDFLLKQPGVLPDGCHVK